MLQADHNFNTRLDYMMYAAHWYMAVRALPNLFYK